MGAAAGLKRSTKVATNSKVSREQEVKLCPGIVGSAAGCLNAGTKSVASSLPGSHLKQQSLDAAYI
eukprot:scaffold34458_cov21-Tisochrysis_lutea.AAC.1